MKTVLCQTDLIVTEEGWQAQSTVEGRKGIGSGQKGCQNHACPHSCRQQTPFFKIKHITVKQEDVSPYCLHLFLADDTW